jgi:SDR family mycofactocin-dependent oxidoreductase
MGKLDGQVAVVTGGARGQGRSHAIHIAREGADVVICDVCHDLDAVRYPMATPDDLEETVRLVEKEGRRCVALQADVRDYDQVAAVTDRAAEEFGKIDILIANAGVMRMNPIQDHTPDQWRDVVDTNLTGVYHAMHAVAPHLIRNNYGRIVATASTMARGAAGNSVSYVAAKWGVVGMVKSVAQDLAPWNVTVNAVAPTSVSTHMIHNEDLYKLFRPDLAEPTIDDVREAFKMLNVIPVSWLEPEDVSKSVLFLLSEDAKYITGSVIDINAGHSARVP